MDPISGFVYTEFRSFGTHMLMIPLHVFVDFETIGKILFDSDMPINWTVLSLTMDSSKNIYRSNRAPGSRTRTVNRLTCPSLQDVRECKTVIKYLALLKGFNSHKHGNATFSPLSPYYPQTREQR